MGDGCTTSHVHEVVGKGIVADVNDHRVAVGNERMMEAEGAALHPCKRCEGHAGTVVHVAIDGRYAGHVVISDQVKADASEALRALRQLGVKQTVMLTGDKEAVARQVAQQVGIDSYAAELLPADKVDRVERLIQQSQEKAPSLLSAMVSTMPQYWHAQM